jgi:D-alanyl-lipoteichoic acid acyltransferase DltB (MBOAT superfamily)
MCWEPGYAILLVVSTLIDYICGLMMGRYSRSRKAFLLLSMATNLTLLAVFKYYNFFNATFRAIFEQFGIPYSVAGSSLLLPVGISFYTFQTMSYTIDVYRGVQKPERHLGIFALYVTFFPQLVAGPIERSTNLLPQFREVHSYDTQRAFDGLKLMAWGLFKKAVIADRLAVMVDAVYNSPQAFRGLPLVVATVFFAFQIYCDFSGYSDMAIGMARLLGFRLMKNFDRPYHAKSISEFWARWHISLSTWFKDYLYIPLGGNRVPRPRWYFNLFVTFLISGFWHGADWKFVLWGALHGMFLIASIAFDPVRQYVVGKLNLSRSALYTRYFKVAVTFALVCLSWILFRANSLGDALYITSNLFSGVGDMSLFLRNRYDLLVVLLSIAVMEVVHLLQRRGSLTDLIGRRPFALRLAMYGGFAIAVAVFSKMSAESFIYFQF